jgi:hypothetical protein
MEPWPTFSVNVKLLLHSDMYIWAPFLDPEDIKSSSLGPSATLTKEQGFLELVSDYGTQRAHF